MVPPEVVAGAGSERQVTGRADFDVRPGQLWTLAWDGELLGRVLVSSVKARFILGWPVTMPGEESFAPGMVVVTPLGVPATAWPTRETGLGLHLLDRLEGELLSLDEVRHIGACIDEDEDPGLPFADGKSNDSDNQEANAALVEKWARLCFHTGGAENQALYLNDEKVRAVGGTARDLAALLDLDVAAARTLWLGEEPLTAEQCKTVGERYDVDPSSLARPDPSLSWWEMLAQPLYKGDVVQSCLECGENEAEVRLKASRSAYALAARDDNSARTEQKLRDVIGGVCSGQRNGDD